MKKWICGIVVFLVIVTAFVGIKLYYVNTSFIGLVGENWNSVTLYYYGDEMILNNEEIQKVRNIFADMSIKCNGFVDGRNSGFIDIIYVNNKSIIVKGSTIVLGVFEYQVTGNPNYTEQLFQLEEEFAAVRGIPLKN